MPDASIVVTMDDKYSDAVKKMSSVTKSFSKDIDQLEDTLYALNKNKISLKIDLGTVKSELKAAEKQFQQTQSAADGLRLELIQANYDNIARNLEAVTRAVGETEEAISQAENQAGGGDTQAAKSIMNTVAASGIGQMLKDVTLNMGTAVAGSMFGEAGGTIAANMLSSGATGAVAGTAILGPGVGTAIGAAVGAALGGISGYFQNLEKKDDTYKSWYRGVYENAGKETDRMLTAGRSAAQETLGQPEAELKAVQGKLDAAGGEGYYAERNQGIAEQITAYGGELGEALAEANRAIGAGRAAMENLADSYTQEALSAVLTGSETSLQWSDDNAQRLQELGMLYQEAMADYEAGNTEAGALVETYIEEARALAEAQYDSSEAALGVAEAEKDLITSINENTAALRGWRGDYDINQALTKGQAVSLLPESNLPDNPGSIDYNADQDSTIQKWAVGIGYVPYDNFPALLHQGERVQTAVEARSERRSPAITITGNSFSIREDADVDRVASALLQKIELAERRAAVRDKMTAAGNTTAEMIRQPAMTLTGYEARVVVNSSDYSFSLEFLGEENTLADIDVRQVRRMVEQIKPAHLQFMISGLTWDDTESTDPTWQWFECHSLVGLRVMVEVIP